MYNRSALYQIRQAQREINMKEYGVSQNEVYGSQTLSSGVFILNFYFYGNKKFDIRMLWIIWIYLSYLPMFVFTINCVGAN